MDSLVRLMGIVDKHILDAAELQLNVIPVSYMYCTCTQCLLICILA